MERNKNYIAKYSGYRYNEDGTIKVTDDWTDKEKPKIPARYKNYAVIETVETKKGITHHNRTIYDSDGNMAVQIHPGNHGNPKTHPYGKNGEHKHIILWSDGKIVSREPGELNTLDRKRHGDIL